MNLQSLTQSLGFLLIIIGLATYFGSGQTSITALIPTLFGLFFVIFGQLAKREDLRKKMMHTAVGLAVLGLLGASRGIPGIIAMFSGDKEVHALAVYSQIAMFLMCLVYIIAAVQSFRKARNS